MYLQASTDPLEVDWEKKLLACADCLKVPTGKKLCFIERRDKTEIGFFKLCVFLVQTQNRTIDSKPTDLARYS